MLVAYEPDELNHPPGLLRVHAGEGLVEQHELRVGGKRHRHAKRALMAVGQVGGSFRRPVAAENALDETRLGAAVTAEPDIVEHAELMEQGRALKGADQSK